MSSKKRKSYVVVTQALDETYETSWVSIAKQFKSQMMSDDKIAKLKDKDWDTGTMKKLIPKKAERKKFRIAFKNSYNLPKKKPTKTAPPMIIKQSDEVLTEVEEPDPDDTNDEPIIDETPINNNTNPTESKDDIIPVKQVCIYWKRYII